MVQQIDNNQHDASPKQHTHRKPSHRRSSSPWAGKAVPGKTEAVAAPGKCCKLTDCLGRHLTCCQWAAHEHRLEIAQPARLPQSRLLQLLDRGRPVEQLAVIL